MKEKFIKAAGALISWKGIKWMNAVLGTGFLVALVVSPHPACVMSVATHFGWFILSLAGEKEEERTYKALHLAALYDIATEDMRKTLERYRELYGDLPEANGEESEEKENMKKK